MDYDATEIPAVYDLGRDHGPAVADLWMTQVVSYVGGHSVNVILDLGCGTGRFSSALADRFNASLIGLDPSKKMLAQARTKETGARVTYACGAGEALPLRDGTLDLIFMSMVFHHFTNTKQVILECRRVLREGGHVFVRTCTIERVAQYPYVDVIPQTERLLRERMPASDFIQSVFESAGFSPAAGSIVVQEIAPTYGAYVTRLAAGGDSVLASVSPVDLEAVLQALRNHAARVDPQPVTEPIDVFVFAP